jgi:hypothetical protein
LLRYTICGVSWVLRLALAELYVCVCVLVVGLFVSALAGICVLAGFFSDEAVLFDGVFG